MNRSESIDKLVESFSKAQGSFKRLVPNEYAAGGKFANLEAVLDSVREALSSNGLSFYQQIELLEDGNGVSLLHSVISHSSGQWISTKSRIVPGPTFRETFNCIESYRRLSALLLLGIAPSGNDPLIHDDNGQEQQEKEMVKNIKRPELAVKSEFPETVTADQYKELMFELDGYPDIAKGIQVFYKISSLADLPKSEYYVVQNKIRKLKKTHEDYAVAKR